MKRPSKKGFTLLEAIIAMTVTMVLLTMILSLVVSVIKNTEKSRHENDVFSDLNIAETQIRNWFSSYGEQLGDEYTYEFLTVNKFDGQGEDAYFPADSADVLAVCVFGELEESGAVLPIATLEFDGKTKLLSCSDKYVRFHLSNIDRIAFEKTESVIKVSVFYDGKTIPQILLFNERLKYVP